MQAQMQSQDNESLSDSIPDLRQPNPLGAIGRTAPGEHNRETDSPMRTGRGIFADMFAPTESSRTPVSSEALHGGVSSAPTVRGSRLRVAHHRTRPRKHRIPHRFSIELC